MVSFVFAKKFVFSFYILNCDLCYFFFKDIEPCYIYYSKKELIYSMNFHEWYLFLLTNDDHLYPDFG